MLEVGCGSGVVSIHCTRCGASVVCGDINPRAVELATRNARANGVEIGARITDVYSGVDGVFDTIVFNLPYLPTEDDAGPLAVAWNGGRDGLGPLPKLLDGAKDHLAPGGRIVIVTSSLMDQERLSEILSGFSTEVLAELPLFFEMLRVLCIRIK